MSSSRVELKKVDRHLRAVGTDNTFCWKLIKMHCSIVESEFELEWEFLRSSRISEFAVCFLCVPFHPPTHAPPSDVEYFISLSLKLGEQLWFRTRIMIEIFPRTSASRSVRLPFLWLWRVEAFFEGNHANSCGSCWEWNQTHHHRANGGEMMLRSGSCVCCES